MRKIVDGVDDHIDVAVIVEISERAASRRHRCGDTRPGIEGNVIKAPIAQIFVEQLALRVACFRFELLDFGVHMAVANQDVGPAVVVEVEKAAPPAKILGVLAEAALKCSVLEISAAEIVIERRSVAGKIGLDQIEITVEIVIGGGDAHPGLWLAVGAESAARFQRNVSEGAVFFVLIKSARGRIVGDINVGPTIVVEIGGQHAKTVGAIGFEDAGFFANVRKRPVAVIVIQDIFPAV